VAGVDKKTLRKQGKPKNLTTRTWAGSSCSPPPPPDPIHATNTQSCLLEVHGWGSKEAEQAAQKAEKVVTAQTRDAICPPRCVWSFVQLTWSFAVCRFTSLFTCPTRWLSAHSILPNICSWSTAWTRSRPRTETCWRCRPHPSSSSSCPVGSSQQNQHKEASPNAHTASGERGTEHSMWRRAGIGVRVRRV
jgi:hypothetical protein